MYRFREGTNELSSFTERNPVTLKFTSSDNINEENNKSGGKRRGGREREKARSIHGLRE